MDYKELIKQLKEWNEQYVSEMCADDKFSCYDLCDGKDCIVCRAATAIETLLAERDAAVEEMHGRCIKCNHFSVGFLDYPCTDCRYEGGANDHWKWSGPQKENKED